jgi:hypothetical protein
MFDHAAYERHLDWRSGAMQSQEPLVMCQVCSPCCSMSGDYFCKGCGLPLCMEAIHSGDQKCIHDVVLFSVAVQRGLCRREDWES